MKNDMKPEFIESFAIRARLRQSDADAIVYCERINIGLSALLCFGNSLRFAIEVIPETKSPNLTRAKYSYK
ncbi:MAG: hypothetical protein GY862_08670 [Gammaproteobacteria bacterium]|nr:hypothetical protein [Gammaproteobacteria bacterium]